MTRHELNGVDLRLHPNPHWSQDVWAFDTSSEVSSSLFAALNIPLGVPRCDNKIAYLFKIHGWELSNPYPQIVAGHAHETQLRTYDKNRDLTVIGGVAYVYPTSRGKQPSEVDIDVWTVSSSQIRHVKLNKSLEVALQTPSAGASSPSQKSKYTSAHGQPTNPSETAVTVLTKKKKRRPVRSAIRKVKRAILDAGSSSIHRFTSNSTSPDPRSPITPVLRDGIPSIAERPRGKWDHNFWQYPCATEKAAFENHLDLPLGTNIDERKRIAHTYLGLPWATYIDRNIPLSRVADGIRHQVERKKKIATRLGLDLRVHTVCQHYAWKRIEKDIKRCGVTDLHISHCTVEDQITDSGSRLRRHSWPLFAPNVERPLRSIGIIPLLPLDRKRYLASFVGAHMSHYRSEVRILLKRAIDADGGADVLFELGDLWHFNKAVYEEQVKGTTVATDQRFSDFAAAARYNEILSRSVFSLCPEGAGPNTLRLWESLAIGVIPVVIADDWIPPDLPGAQVTMADACIFCPSSELDNLLPRLRNIATEEIKIRQRACLEYYLAARRKTVFEFNAGQGQVPCSNGSEVTLGSYDLIKSSAAFG